MSRHPLFGGPPLLAVSGSSWGPGRCVVACSLDSVWSLAIAGAQVTRACSRLSPPVPGPHGGRGHTCRTPPWACSVCSQSDASCKRVRSCRTRCVQLGVGSRHPRPYIVNGVRMDTLGHCGAPVACTVVGPSGRAGGPVKENACRREGHADRGREDSSRCSQPAASVNRVMTHKGKMCSRTQPFTLEMSKPTP